MINELFLAVADNVESLIMVFWQSSRISRFLAFKQFRLFLYCEANGMLGRAQYVQNGGHTNNLSSSLFITLLLAVTSHLMVCGYGSVHSNWTVLDSERVT